MSRVRFLAAACLDIRAAFAWYDTQRLGLGNEFIGAVESALAHVAAHPHAQPEVHRGARRCLIARFPYGLYYRVDDEGVLVVACLHAARDPESWRARLDASADAPRE